MQKWETLVFIVSSVEISDRSDFETLIVGKSGVFFYPMLSLNKEIWLNELKQAAGNFGFGFQRIKNSIVISGLSKIAASAKII